MSNELLTEPKVFIIESLSFDDETDNHYEGQIISKILSMSLVKHKYYYIRTKKEFKHLMKEFKNEKYRYLHISCHGDEYSIGTTLENIDFEELNKILKSNLLKKRLFISACSAVNDNLADIIFKESGCYSIVGPNEDINFDDAAVFWASFYQIMFKKNNKGMARDAMQEVLIKLVDLHGIQLKYYNTCKSNPRGWTEVDLT